ncbi:MAG TPA: hypothetical protein VHM91_17620 [Verrucomicrobiales bacterium]|jgi:hypothetical protein|nr:hypothetical protein [Verrucomicrobiales bacterium]
MNPHSLIDQIELLVRNGAPSGRIQALFEDLRTQVSLLERLLDSPLEMILSPPHAVPDENVAAVPVWEATPAEEPKSETSATTTSTPADTPDVEPPPPRPGSSGEE